MEIWPAMPTRSWPRVPMATIHPSPSPPEAAVERDHRVVEEDLVEHLLAGHVADRAGLDPRGVHVDDEGGDALVLGPPLDGGGIGPQQEEPPAGQVGGRDPDLLAVDHVGVAVPDGRRPQVGQVVAGVGLGEPLAPVVGGVEDRGKPPLLLLVGAPGDDHRADLPEAVGVEQARRPVLGHHLGVDDALHGGGIAAAVLHGPAHRRPPAPVEEALPCRPSVLGLLARERGVVGQLLAGQERREVLVEPRPQFVAERFIFRGQCEVHGRGG